MGLTDEERAAFDAFTEGLSKLFHMMSAVPCHPADITEVTAHVHAIQNVVLARAAVRSDLNAFNHTEQFCGRMPRHGAALICRHRHGQ